MNSLDIVLIIASAAFLLLWLVYAVKFIIARGKIRRRNSFIWRQRQEKAVLKASLRSETAARTQAEEDLEAARAANLSLMGKPVEEGTVAAPLPDLRNILDQTMQTTQCYLKTGFSKDDFAEMLNLSKKELDEALGKLSFGDYLSSWRMDHAIDMMQADPEKEIEAVASESGFADAKAMNRACKVTMGMDTEELRVAMKL